MGIFEIIMDTLVFIFATILADSRLLVNNSVRAAPMSGMNSINEST